MSVRPPRRYRLEPPPEAAEGPGALVWWDGELRCYVSARYLDDGGRFEVRHERLAEVVHELERDAVVTDSVLRALLSDRAAP